MFVGEHLQDDIPTLILKKSPFDDISSKELAEQIDSKKRCELKLPLWFNSCNIFYPPKISIEQASSEIAAKYKASLIEGNDIIDLTGGFGVDSFFFALKAESVTHCELNKELSELSKHNSEILGVKINYVNANGIDYLKNSNKKFSTIYIDPSRRIESKKVFKLKDCEPDIVGNLNLLKNHSDHIIIKTAPLLDIKSTIRELDRISEVHVISIKNECKELLLVINKDNLSDNPLITCLLHNETEIKYSFKISEESIYTISNYSEPLQYLYEPDVGILKAGCFKLICRDFKVEKLHQHTHLYTSNDLNELFPGRKFKVKKTWSFGQFQKDNKIKQANIICRNFGLSPEELKKKLKIKDGGSEYLLFCIGKKDQLMVLNCVRI